MSISWIELKFGKHIGKTLPQVLCKDPDWFYYEVEENNFYQAGIKAQVDLIGPRSRRIRVPEGCSVLYFTNPTAKNKFDHFQIVDDSVPTPSHNCFKRTPYLDMLIPRRIANYDKLGYQNLLADFRSEVLGVSKITKSRAESFWSNPDNFLPFER